MTHGEHPNGAILVVPPRHQYVVASLHCPKGQKQRVPKCLGHASRAGQNIERLHAVPGDLSIKGNKEVQCASSPKSRCFVLCFQISFCYQLGGTYLGPHSRCRICPTANGTCVDVKNTMQNITTEGMMQAVQKWVLFGLVH